MENTQTKIEEASMLPEDNHPVEKLPDAVVLKFARQEIGELLSYIDELEDKVKFLKQRILKFKSLTSEENKEFKRMLFFKEWKGKIAELEKTVKELRKDKEMLLYKKLSDCRECLLKGKENGR